ncbi:tyrosine sulfotransferase-like protein [Thalictrum thalictroides]|uniref:Tyrosine sulfotransferase-like protein n=1 Tax=Thalictrum thalictroides TaxID=46969 RepID=A0A7J6W8P3_THATH|nr:tyrosine sulfotransferase-like protein [Thalictrum thalictroides]
MAGKAAKSIVKTVGEFQYPWKEKLVKYKDELSKGVWGYWELGAWKPLGISARRRARLRKEVLLAEQDWPYDPARKEMRTKRKGHKVCFGWLYYDGSQYVPTVEVFDPLMGTWIEGDKMKQSRGYFVAPVIARRCNLCYWSTKGGQ